MSAYIQNFIKFQPLLGELIARDIKIKYRRSVLGVLWTLLNPLCMMIVLSVVFSNIFKFDIENFPLYILSGQLIFNFFSDATTSSMSSIVSSASLIKKVYVPKYLFVISHIFSSFINLMASFTALLLVMTATRTALDDAACAGTAALAGSVLAGSGIGSCGCYCQVPGYHASVFGIYHSAHVSDAGDLSDGDAAGMADRLRDAQSDHEYRTYVP